MKLLTKAIENAFVKQGDTSEKDASQIKIVLKLFGGTFTWYLYEHINGKGDYYMAFVNLGDSQMAECGEVSLSEIAAIRLRPFGLRVERDMYFNPLSITLKEVMDKVKSGGHV